MRKNFLLQLVLALFVLVTFFACKKMDPIDLKKICRIETINTITGDQFMRRYFTYNEYGNPLNVRFDDDGTGTAPFNFYYDHRQRLIGYNGYALHKYTYDARGLAIVDTIHANYAGSGLWYEEKLFYDRQQRVIKTITKLYEAPSPDEPTLNQEVVTHYRYDQNGNLIRPGVVYDNKINMLRTNKVWMLVHLDYSVNNPLPGPTTYNQIGLPLDPAVVFLNHFSAEVTYDCKNLGESKTGR